MNGTAMLKSTPLSSGEDDEDRCSNEQLLERDRRYVLRPWGADAEPLPVVAAEGLYVWDADGKRYADLTSGYFVNQAGHRHPDVLDAAADQLARVTQVAGRQATEASVALAQQLSEVAPASLHKTLFTTGGCESIEFAIKMARQRSGKPRIAYLENGFHGLSVTALSACSDPEYRASAAAPLDDAFVPLPTPYCYRCPCAGRCDLWCVDRLERTLDANPHVGAILAEPIQAVGAIIPSREWWSRVDRIRRERGLLLILDEVQTGLGRTGARFAAEHYGLEPDVMTVAKGLSGGIGSLGAVMASKDVCDAFYGATSPTSAANAVSCAAGRALIEVIRREKLCENAAAMGRYLAEGIAEPNLA